MTNHDDFKHNKITKSVENRFQIKIKNVSYKRFEIKIKIKHDLKSRF